ncbi:MAG: hypothetical protein M3441_07345 [Chloroflexota bacterium]|nr:hypothetical protein [Chloroflexota bacterium]
MSFFICHVYGDNERDPPLDSLEHLYAEKDVGDDDHFGVSVIHETEWCLTLLSSNTLIWENLEAGDNPQHMKNVPKDKVLDLWSNLARGDITTVDAEPWLEGYY